MSACKGCGAAIAWTETATGKKMPLNPARIRVVPSSQTDAPLKVVLDNGTVISARAASADEVEGVVSARTSHFATCPQARAFRERGR